MGALAPIRSALAAARDVLFPPICPLCREETGADGTLCPSCWQETAFLDGGGCRSCGRPIPGAADEPDLTCEDCLRYAPLWHEGRAALRYEGGGRRLVLGLKHADRLDTVPMLGAWMLRVGRGLLDKADLVAPIPLHWTRRLKRRNNQAASLARWLCRAEGRPGTYAPGLLVRQRRTESQEGKSRAARTANLEGSLIPGPGAARMKDRRVLLIDDVMTTGATLNAAAKVCLDAGAARVDILVLALVVRDETAYIPMPDENEDEAPNGSG